MPKSEYYPGFYEPEGIKPLSGLDTVKYVQEELGQSTVLLSFSCGKDSVALWLAMREHFEIIPFYLYRIPGISFVEDSLRYYENFFGQEIIRLPHPDFYSMIINFVWQPPQRVAWIHAMGIKQLYYDDINWVLGKKFGLETPMCCTGIRAVDNVRRRVYIKRSGPINMKRNYFYPIWDINMAGILQMFVDAKIKLAIDYRLFGRSFDGMDYRFVNAVKENYPEDWELLKQWFPFIEMEIMRYSAYEY
ncbi:MAG: phosphoadenosine phosphosulfate reductase [Planctomycetaceae bacterium]|nr:phosphoadenosine phosphosulfate reductase [Planctomycetaceae bacterium]